MTAPPRPQWLRTAMLQSVQVYPINAVHSIMCRDQMSMSSGHALLTLAEAVL